VIKRNRKRTWRQTASEKEADARPFLRAAVKATPTPTPPCIVLERGKWRLDSKVPAVLEAPLLAHVDRLNKIEHGKVRKGGKDREYSKTQLSRAKYAPLIIECDRRDVSLDDLDSVMGVVADLGLNLTRGQVYKHLYRHHRNR
jgi:hypothetical protein